MVSAVVVGSEASPPAPHCGERLAPMSGEEAFAPGRGRVGFSDEPLWGVKEPGRQAIQAEVSPQPSQGLTDKAGNLQTERLEQGRGQGAGTQSCRPVPACRQQGGAHWKKALPGSLACGASRCETKVRASSALSSFPAGSLGSFPRLPGAKCSVLSSGPRRRELGEEGVVADSLWRVSEGQPCGRWGPGHQVGRRAWPCDLPLEAGGG